MANVQGDLKGLDIPIGYKFCPSPALLTVSYLKNKILGKSLPADIISTVDVYSSSPDQLPLDDFKYGKENEWYFFSPTRNCNSNIILTSNGYYSVILDNYHICDKIDGDGDIVGFMRVLGFHYGKPPSATRPSWIIFEFRVNPESIELSEDDHSTREKVSNFVACKIVFREKQETEKNLQQSHQA